jgi:Flp pilus assembly protein TadB
MARVAAVAYHRVKAMADLDKITDELASKAVVAATKDAAKRTVEDLLATDEERAEREAERAASSKSRRNKLIIYGVLGSLLVVGLVGMVLNYWYWFILLGVAGLAGVYAWRKLIKHRAAKKARIEEPIEAPAKKHIADADARAGEARALAEAEVEEEQQIEDELAAMKARIRK